MPYEIIYQTALRFACGQWCGVCRCDGYAYDQWCGVCRCDGYAMISGVVCAGVMSMVLSVVWCVQV